MEIQRLNAIIEQNGKHLPDSNDIWNQNRKCPVTVCRSVMTSPADQNYFRTKEAKGENENKEKFISADEYQSRISELSAEVEKYRTLSNSIKENGLIHSEDSLDTEQKSSNFPFDRNKERSKNQFSEQDFVVMESKAKSQRGKGLFNSIDEETPLTNSWISLDFDNDRFVRSLPVSAPTKRSKSVSGTLSETLYPKLLRDANRPSFSYLKKTEEEKNTSQINERPKYANATNFDVDDDHDVDTPSAWMAEEQISGDEDETEENNVPRKNDYASGDRYTKSFNYISQPRLMASSSKQLSASTNNFLQRQKLSQPQERPSFNYLKKQPKLETVVDSDSSNNIPDYFSSFVEYGILPLRKSESGLKPETDHEHKKSTVITSLIKEANDENKFSVDDDVVAANRESESESERELGSTIGRVNFDGLNTSSATAYNSSFSSQSFANNKDGRDNHFSPTNFFMQNLKVNFEDDNSLGEEQNDSSSLNNDRSRNARKVVRARAELRRLQHASDSSTASESSARRQKNRIPANEEPEKIPEVGDFYIYDTNIASDMASLNGDSLDVDSDKEDRHNKSDLFQSSIFHSSFKKSVSDDESESVAEEIDVEHEIVADPNESDVAQDIFEETKINGNVAQNENVFWNAETTNSDGDNTNLNLLVKTKSFLEEDPKYSSMDSIETVVSSPSKQLLDKMVKPTLLDMEDRTSLSSFENGTSNVVSSPSKEALVIRIKLIEREKADIAEIPVIDFLSPADFSDDYTSDEAKSASGKKRYYNLPPRFKLRRNNDGLKEMEIYENSSFGNDSVPLKKDWSTFGLTKPTQENTRSNSNTVIYSDFFDTSSATKQFQRQTSGELKSWIHNKTTGISSSPGIQSPAQSASFSSDFEPESPVHKQHDDHSPTTLSTSNSNDHTETDIKIAVTSLQMIQTGLIPWVLFDKFPSSQVAPATNQTQPKRMDEFSIESNSKNSSINSRSPWAWSENEKIQKSFSISQPLSIEEIEEIQDEGISDGKPKTSYLNRSFEEQKLQSTKTPAKLTKSLGHESFAFDKNNKDQFHSKISSSFKTENPDSLDSPKDDSENRATAPIIFPFEKLTDGLSEINSLENSAKRSTEINRSDIDHVKGSEKRDLANQIDRNAKIIGSRDAGRGYENPAFENDFSKTLPLNFLSQQNSREQQEIHSARKNSMKEFHFSSGGISRDSFFKTSSHNESDNSVDDGTNQGNFFAQSLPAVSLRKMETNLQDDFKISVQPYKKTTTSQNGKVLTSSLSAEKETAGNFDLTKLRKTDDDDDDDDDNLFEMKSTDSKKSHKFMGDYEGTIENDNDKRHTSNSRNFLNDESENKNTFSQRRSLQEMKPVKDVLSQSLDNYSKNKESSEKNSMKEIHFSSSGGISRDNFFKPQSMENKNNENVSIAGDYNIKINVNEKNLFGKSETVLPLTKIKTNLIDNFQMNIRPEEKATTTTNGSNTTKSLFNDNNRETLNLSKPISSVAQEKHSEKTPKLKISDKDEEDSTYSWNEFVEHFGTVIPAQPLVETIDDHGSTSDTTKNDTSNRRSSGKLFGITDRETFFNNSKFAEIEGELGQTNKEKKLDQFDSLNGPSGFHQQPTSSTSEDREESDKLLFSSDRLPVAKPNEKTKSSFKKFSSSEDSVNGSEYMNNLNKYLPSPILDLDHRKRHNPFAFSSSMGTIDKKSHTKSGDINNPETNSFREFVSGIKGDEKKSEKLEEASAGSNSPENEEEKRDKLPDDEDDIQLNVESEDDENYPEIGYRKHDDELDLEELEDVYLVPYHHIDLDDDTQQEDSLLYYFDKKSENVIDPTRKVSLSKSLDFDTISEGNALNKRLSESYPKVNNRNSPAINSNLTSKSVSRDSLKLDFKDLVDQNNSSLFNDEDDSETKRRKSVSWSDLREGLPLENGPEWGSPHSSPLKPIIKRPSVTSDQSLYNHHGHQIKPYLLPFSSHLQDSMMTSKSDQNLNSDRSFRHAFAQTEPLPQTKSVSTLTIQELLDSNNNNNNNNNNKNATATPTPSVSMENLKRYQAESVVNDLQTLVQERDKLLENMNNELALWNMPSTSLSSYRSDTARNLMNEQWWKLWRIKNDLDKRIDELFLKFKTQKLLGIPTVDHTDWLNVPHSALLTWKNKISNRPVVSSSETCPKIHLTPFEYDKKLVNLRKTLVSTAKDLHHRSVPDLNSSFETLDKQINEFDWKVPSSSNKKRFTKNWMNEIDNELKFGAPTTTTNEQSSLSILQEARQVRQLSNSVLQATKHSLNQPRFFPTRLKNEITTSSSMFNKSQEDKQIDEEIQKLRNQYKIKQILGYKY